MRFLRSIVMAYGYQSKISVLKDIFKAGKSVEEYQWATNNEGRRSRLD